MGGLKATITQLVWWDVTPTAKHEAQKIRFVEEIPDNHLGCINPCRKMVINYISTGAGFLSINSMQYAAYLCVMNLFRGSIQS